MNTIPKSLNSIAAMFAVLVASVHALADDPISFTKQIVPILKKECTGCHQPGKLKGKLDLTTFAGFAKGGKDGAGFVAGKPDESIVMKMITGDPPDMPEDADPLPKEQVELIAQWIRQGAVDDTPAEEPAPLTPPVYAKPPVIVTMAFSPDGSLLAVNGYHEVVLHKADGTGIVGRLLGRSPRIESIAFSKDGARLAAVGGSPAMWGHVQVWNLADRTLHREYKLSSDSLYGVSFSPDGTKLAFGGADKIARLMNIDDGQVLIEFKNHSDWVFATTFTVDGKIVLSGGRDKAMKLIDTANGRFIDDINNPLDTVNCFARHPTEDMVAYGGDLGAARIYKISDNQNRTAARNDTNLVRTFERLPAAIHAIAYRPDGAAIAVGTVGEVRVYAAADGKLLTTLSGHEGAIFAVAFTPDGSRIATGGYDGKVRLFNAADGKLISEFTPVPIETHASRDE